MKKHELIFSILKIPLDFLIIFASFFIARDIRKVTDLLPWIDLPVQTISDDKLLKFALIWSLLYLLIFSLHNLYSLKITSSKIKEILDIIRYSVYWFFFYSAFVYFSKDFIYKLEIPRLVVIFSLVIWTFLVIFNRILLNFVQNFMLRKWKLSKRRILFISNRKKGNIKEIFKDLASTKVYDFSWYVNKSDIRDPNLKYIWGIKDLKKLLEKRKIDEILYVDSDFDEEEKFEIYEYSKIYGVRYRYVTNYFDVTKTNTEVSLLNKLTLMEIKSSKLDAPWRILKRLSDGIFAFFALLFLFPVFLVVWILIKLEDPAWPIFYKNRRVWQWWKIFTLYKFRYMKWKYCVKDSYWIKEKEDEALEYEKKLIEELSTRKWPLYKIKNDPRKTKIGAFIEKTSIDELPQFFNVFIWNMSLVWPRPHQPREVSKYKEYQKRVLNMKPWITGMAQVNGREENSFDDEVKLDIFYMENWTMLLDLKIVFKTVLVVLNRIKK